MLEALILGCQFSSRGLSIHEHQAVYVLSFRFFPQGFYEEVIVSCRLIDINAARLHRRPCPVTEGAGSSAELCTFPAKRTGPCEKNKGPIIAVFEHIPFQVHQHVKILLEKRPAALAGCLWGLNMKQDSALVRVKDSPHLLRHRGIRRTAVSLAIRNAAKLAFQAHPRRCHDAAWVDWFCVCCLSLQSSGTVFL